MASYRKAYAAYKSGALKGERRAKFERLIDSGVVPVQEYENESAGDYSRDDLGTVVQLKKPISADKAFLAFAAGEMDEDQAARFQEAMKSGKYRISPEIIQQVNRQNLEAQYKAEKEAAEPVPETTLGGQLGGIVRGLGPTALGAAAGLSGGIAAPVTVPIGAVAGSLARPVIDPVVGIANSALRAVGIDANIPDATQSFKFLFDSLGIPVPDTAMERFTQDVAEAVSGTTAAVKGGQALAKYGGKLAQGIGGMLAEAPMSQLASDVAATSAGSAVAESDLPPWVQMPASLAAGVVSGAATAPRRTPHATAATPGRLTLDEMAAATKTATGAAIPAARKRMMKVLAEQADPDPETVKAAKRLGIENYLQPDHLTTNQAFREYSQALKSEVGSPQRQREIAGFIEVGKRADDLIEEIGGTRDFSTLGSDIRKRMNEVSGMLDNNANQLYGKIRSSIPADAPVRAENILSFIDERSANRRGNRMTADESRIKRILEVDESGNPPTYTDLDDMRKDIGQALRGNSGPFKDADQGFLKKMYEKLSDDQRLVAEEYGVADVFDSARGAVKQRKAIEDDMTALFGARLDQSIAPKLKRAMKGLAGGDYEGLEKILLAAPPDMRPTIVASGLNTVLKRQLGEGEVSYKNFYKWHNALKGQRKAYIGMLKNLPAGAASKLEDLSNVSEKISRALDQRISTGKLADFRMSINGADTIAASMMDIAKNTAIRSGMELFTSLVGLPGYGLAAAFASSIGQQAARKQRNLFKEAQSMLASDEFVSLVASLGQAQEKAATKKFLNSAKFKRFWGGATNPKNVTPAQWMRTVIAASRDRRDDVESDTEQQ